MDLFKAFEAKKRKGSDLMFTFSQVLVDVLLVLIMLAWLSWIILTTSNAENWHLAKKIVFAVVAFLSFFSIMAACMIVREKGWGIPSDWVMIPQMIFFQSTFIALANKKYKEYKLSSQFDSQKSEEIDEKLLTD
jgi:hypothetical protein